jgi:sugar/nucleoside kinase (ribokinase family)
MTKYAMYDLISIGSITRDVFVSTDRGKIFKTPKDKLAPVWLGFELGEKICVDEIVETEGGVATNLSIGTKKLGLKSSAIGPQKPAISVIVIDKKTGERVVFYQKSSGAINLSKLNKIKTKWLSVSSLTGKWTKQADQIAKYVAKTKIGLILLPSTSQIRDDFSDLKKLLKITKILILNKNEALEIASKMKGNSSDKYVFNYVIKYLHSLGPEIVSVTDGRRGAWASDGTNILHIPIIKVKAVDCTGAGDAFAAGFLGFFLKGAPLKESLRAGIANSASVVQYIGTTKGLMTRKEIKNKL